MEREEHLSQENTGQLAEEQQTVITEQYSLPEGKICIFIVETNSSISVSRTAVTVGSDSPTIGDYYHYLF